MRLSFFLLLAVICSASIVRSQPDSCCPNITYSITGDNNILVGGHYLFTILLHNPDSCTWKLKSVLPSSSDLGEFTFTTLFPDSIQGYGTFYIPFELNPTQHNHQYQLTLRLVSPPPCETDTVTMTYTGMTIDDASAPILTSADGFQLGQNYPNPTGSLTSFTYTVPAETSVTIHISDIYGKIVRIISNGTVSAGEHSITADLSGLPNGSYLLIVESDGIRLARQIIINH